MRSVVRILTAGFAVTLAALPLVLAESSTAGAVSSHALTAPAQVSASNWMTMPTTATPNGTSVDTGVSCVNSVFCMAVGNFENDAPGASTAEIWNGRTWTPLTMPTVGASTEPVLVGVSCVTTNFCIAVGYAYYPPGTQNDFTALIEQWNGSAWSVVQGAVAPTPGSDTLLQAVSCLSTSMCVAAGANQAVPYVEQWNGSTWAPTTLSAPSGLSPAAFYGVSCTTVSSCMAVGEATSGASVQVPIAELWNGSSWALTPVSATASAVNIFNGVSCAGPGFCVAVGAEGNNNLLASWNGSSWTLDPSVPTPSGGGTLQGVSCFSATSCTAVGNAGTATQALTWNGQTWTQGTTPAPPPSSTTSQYLAVDCITDWACVAAGDAQFTGSSTTYLPLQAEAPIARNGYRFVASDGGVFNYGPSSGGGAPFLGSMGGQHLNAPIVGMATMPAGDGYYLVASDGGVFNFGSAQFYGSTGSVHLNKPIVGIAVTPDGAGYWLVASDGGVFAYGDAPFYGSMGGQSLNKPIVGIAPTPNGNGYYEVASDGGIFSFPTGASGPPFLGSTGSITLNKPVVGMAVTPSGQYYLVASDGGIFSFPTGSNGPPFYGSTGSIKLNQPVIGMAVATGGAGYYLGAADGGIFSFPQGATGPPFYGSRGGQKLNAPIVGIAG